MFFPRTISCAKKDRSYRGASLFAALAKPISNHDSDGSRSFRADHGFTIIELFVVVAVIAVLASLLLPALGRAKPFADSTDCSSNLRQQGMGLAMYVNDFGVYPAWGRQYPILPEQFWARRLEPCCGSTWPDDYVPGVDAAKKPDKGILACPGYSRMGGVYFHHQELKGSVGGNGAYAMVSSPMLMIRLGFVTSFFQRMIDL